jgi:hypothetical protein
MLFVSVYLLIDLMLESITVMPAASLLSVFRDIPGMLQKSVRSLYPTSIPNASVLVIHHVISQVFPKIIMLKLLQKQIGIQDIFVRSFPIEIKRCETIIPIKAQQIKIECFVRF